MVGGLAAVAEVAGDTNGEAAKAGTKPDTSSGGSFSCGDSEEESEETVSETRSEETVLEAGSDEARPAEEPEARPVDPLIA